MSQPLPITLGCIEQEFKLSLAACAEIIPLENWASQPISVGLHTHKVKFALALEGTKQILFHPAFLGTNSRKKLRYTMRHELAHFCVGCKHNHDKVFTRVCLRFQDGADYGGEEIAAIEANIFFKWQVFGHLKGGHIMDLGGVHKKTALYSNYPHPTKGAFMSVKGVRVDSFEFRAN